MSSHPVPVELRADCARCAALCCVVPRFERSVDFAIDKPAGVPCPNLRPDDRCGIHARLRPAGFRGCAVFDCFGAGQRVTADLALTPDRRGDAAVLDTLRDVLPRVRRVHELLWHLDEAAGRAPSEALRTRAAALQEQAQGLAVTAPADTVEPVVRRGAALLGDISRAVRSDGGAVGADRRGADLLARDLRRLSLARADLRNAVLIAADLRAAHLDRTDLLGADLRDTDLRGTDLGTALFLTQPQIDAARGDTSTVLPPRLHRPTHW